VKLYPDNAAEKVGFDVIRARLEDLVRGRLGADRLAGMRASADGGWIRAELARVDELRRAFQFDDPVPLDHLLDVREVLRRLAPEGAFAPAEDLLAVRLAVANMRRLKGYVEQRREKYPALYGVVEHQTAAPEVEAAVEGAIDDEGHVRDEASPELRSIRRQIIRLQAQVRETLNRELRSAIGAGYATEEQPTIRGGRMVIPVRAEARRKVSGVVQDTSATGQTVYIEPSACIEANNDLRAAEFEEQREVERILRRLSDVVRRHLEPVRQGVRMLAMFDLLQAKARLALELNAEPPVVEDAPVIDVRGGRNPVLLVHFRRQKEGGAAEREVVPLDLRLGDDTFTLVVTGPNAGGKTVAMKTVGLFALMTSLGLPIPARPDSRIGVFDRLMVDIGDEQSMEDDLSTFSSHLANLRYMLANATDASLVLIDEAGTGTDPAEGGALAQALLEELTSRGVRTIATTHHGTLKAFAHETEHVENGSMQFDEKQLSPTYRFLAGIPGSSYAFDIAGRIGLPAPLLGRARSLVGRQKVSLEALIATFQQRAADLDEQLTRARREAGELERRRAEYAERLERLRAERDRIRQDALTEAARIVDEANARVERTIREIREAEAERELTKKAREQLESFGAQVKSRRETAVRREKPRKPQKPSVPDSIRVGDQVVLDDGGAAAEVIEIQGKHAVVAQGSVRMRTRLDRLRKVGGPRKREVRVRMPAGTGAASLQARTHLDVRGHRVDEALPEVMRFVDEAIAAGLDSAEILHGTGTGALRAAIREHLSERTEVVEFSDAPWDQGGPGVTRLLLQ
jgi:DNA mismatch repair protein MutS2